MPLPDRARNLEAGSAIHASALVLDAHADTPQRFLDEGWDFTGETGRGMVSLTEARRGNLAAQFFAVWVDPTEYAPEVCLERALLLTDSVLEQVRRHTDSLRLCLSPADILNARADGRFGILLAIEGGQAIANSLAHLRTFHRLGVRAMTLTWSRHTDWADSSGEAPRHGGLTTFGCDVVREMNRLGMMIDVSHASDATFADVLAVSSVPVIASHSSARALTASPRNLTDEQLRALTKQGGMCMANFFPAFIDERWRQAWEQTKGERQRCQVETATPYRVDGRPVPFYVSNEIDRAFAERIGPPPLSALIDHLEHLLRVAGEDHVGLGSDFDGIPMAPQGLETAAGLWRITEALSARGHGERTLRKVLGGNLMRVFGEVQDARS